MCVCVCMYFDVRNRRRKDGHTSFACINVYACTYLHVCMHINAYTCIHTCMHAYVYTYACVCTHTYMHIHVRMYMHMHTYIHACTHTCMQAYVYTYRHANAGQGRRESETSHQDITLLLALPHSFTTQ